MRGGEERGVLDPGLRCSNWAGQGESSVRGRTAVRCLGCQKDGPHWFLDHHLAIKVTLFTFNSLR